MIEREHTSRVLNAVGACGVLIAMVLTWKHFSRRDSIQALSESVALTDSQWQIAIRAGHRTGLPSAKVTVVVFADFECPACRDFALNSLNPVLVKFPNQVSVLYRHWPLTYHRFAVAAA